MGLQAKLRQARTKAGLSQRELAALAGVPQSTVGRIESGAISPRAETVERLLRVVGCELGIEPIGEGGVDRSLIRRFLRLEPLERVRYSAAAGNATLRLRKGLRKDSSHN